MRTLTAIFVTLVLFTCTICHGQESSLSRKAKKWNEVSNSTTDDDQEDPLFFDFGFEDEDEELEEDYNAVLSSDSTTEDPFFSFDDPFDEDFGSFLPPCNSLFEVDRRPGDNCDNTTVEEPEIRYSDPIFERLIAQVWADFQYKLNNEAQLYGVVLDPFDVDAKLPKSIDLQQQGAGYSANVTMRDIKMYGLSGINLDSVEVTRAENLTDFRARIVFGFDHLEINGTYALKGYFGWWELDSQGEQPFSIKMINATLAYEMDIDLISPDDWTARQCSPLETMETATDNVLIEGINIPLRYDDIDFKFNNLGTFANTVVNGVGIYFLQTQEEFLVGEIRKAIKKNVNSLIC